MFATPQRVFERPGRPLRFRLGDRLGAVRRGALHPREVRVEGRLEEGPERDVVVRSFRGAGRRRRRLAADGQASVTTTVRPATPAAIW